MPIPIGTGDGDGGSGGGADDLADVTLQSFTATPSNIGPFGASTLHWHVNGVNSRVRILLNTSVVAAVGTTSVSPAVSANYTLSAAAGNARKVLGHVIVQVERSTCEEEQLGNLLQLLHSVIYSGIANPTDPKFKTYWIEDPTGQNLTVTLSDDPLARIKIHMYFFVVLDKWYLPNPSVTMDLEFGLGAANGSIIAVAPVSNASVDEGLIGWLLSFYAMLALAAASGDAQKAGRQIIDGLMTYINTVLVHPPAGKKVRSAIAEYRDGNPFFGFIACDTGDQGLNFVLSDLVEVAAKVERTQVQT